MKKLLTAIALTIAIPAAAFAQAAPATAAKADCCEKMKDMASMSHTSHDMKAGADMPVGHAMMRHSAETPQADPRQTTKQ